MAKVKGIFGKGAPDVSEPGQQENRNMGRIRSAAIVAVLILGVLVVFLSYYTVPEGYRGVIIRTGAVAGVANPGLGFKIPFLDSVVDMSVQTQRVDFPDVSAYSRDIQLSVSQVSVNFRLLPDSVGRVYSEVGVDYADRLLAPRLPKRFKEVVGRFAAAEIVNNRTALSEEVETLLRDDMAEFGIAIEDVQITNIDFSDAYESAVEAAAKAEADVKRARQELEQVKVDAQRQVAEAEARAQAVKLAADAEAYQIRAKGEAEASAIAARGKALVANPRLVELIAAEKWNGQLPYTQVPGSAIPFISVPTGTASAQ
jgi:regulator of protease activity HflC (stomatin/prohibitin superfamily)